MPGWLLAAQIAVLANAPASALVCEPVEITVAARAPGPVPPALSLAAAGAWQLLSRRVASRLEHDAAGAPVAVSEGTFVVATPRAGRVAAPVVVARLGGRTARAAARPVQVRDDPAAADEPRVLVQATLDDRRQGARHDTVFVGQQVDYVVEVRLSEAARRRMRRNPTFFPPDMPAVLAYDVEPPPPSGRAGPRCFESLTYRRALFPLFPGAATIPPATLAYAIPVSSSFFSREEQHELRTDSLRFVAIDPPRDGRPADYAGAVAASVRATARLAAGTARMGDPLVVTVRIEGRGNVKLLPRPPLELAWGTVARGAERVEVDSSRGLVRGAKEFDWLISPSRAGAATIDPVRYPYFDPDRATYDVASTEALIVAVAPAILAGADTAVVPRLGIRTTLREPAPPPLTERPLYWLLLAVAPVPATIRRLRRRRRRGSDALSAAQRLQRAAAGSEPLVARELRRLFLATIRERIPSLAPTTGRLPLVRQLRRAGVTERTADAADALLARLDAMAFGPGGVPADALVADVLRLTGEIDAQAVRASAVARAPLALLVAFVVVCASATLGALPDGVSRTFHEGVRAYQAGDDRLARRHFGRVVARAPRAVDGWANFATAAYGVSDTAHAAAGWQRALRLDPLDRDVRRRLLAIHPDAGVASRGYVPPLPASAVASVALALWVAAWLALALPAHRRPPGVGGTARGAIAVAVVTLAGALELRDRLDVRGLGVLRRSGALMELPSAEATRSAAAGAGEVGLVGAREGGWVRIVLDGARAGWVPAAEVLSLADAASD